MTRHTWKSGTAIRPLFTEPLTYYDISMKSKIPPQAEEKSAKSSHNYSSKPLVSSKIL